MIPPVLFVVTLALALIPRVAVKIRVSPFVKAAPPSLIVNVFDICPLSISHDMHNIPDFKP